MRWRRPTAIEVEAAILTTLILAALASSLL
ncbi:hypothetical protein DFR49_2324 [Hephaestia caeni]|uniref:Uncharacterized protein n=1 Tax=Hephaestia caeni TaxID=645617 RepID=A0A397PA84_9SPHN|nr:hypothetical protein DFR49_2324 [Hephaestia caeni]